MTWPWPLVSKQEGSRSFQEFLPLTWRPEVYKNDLGEPARLLTEQPHLYIGIYEIVHFRLWTHPYNTSADGLMVHTLDFHAVGPSSISTISFFIH